MKYVIDEEMLKIQIASIIGDHRGYAIEQDIVDREVDKHILKDKKPIELVEPEYKNKIAIIEGDYELANIEELEELSMQNFELKAKLDSIKYLDRQEVETILSEYRWVVSDKDGTRYEKIHVTPSLITAICDLALPFAKEVDKC